MKTLLYAEIERQARIIFDPHTVDYADCTYLLDGDSLQLMVQKYSADSASRIFKIDLHGDDLTLSDLRLPKEMLHQGLGKALIGLLRDTAQKHERRLLLSHLPRFAYLDFHLRGARIISQGETLEVVAETNLGRERVKVDLTWKR
jgi:hypothetical protein